MPVWNHQSMKALLVLPFALLARGAPVEFDEILPPMPSLFSFIGIANDLSGNFAVIGEAFSDIAQTNAGAVHVYEYEPVPDQWSLRQQLFPSNPQPDLLFGSYIGIAGDTIVVGTEIFTSPPDGGAAYVFERQGGTWIQTARLSGSGDEIVGGEVAIDSDGAVILASGGFLRGTQHVEAFVFVFEKVEGKWTRTARLAPSDPGGSFGRSIAITEDRVVVGAPTDSSLFPEGGAAYVFERRETSWKQVAKLVSSNLKAGDRFGQDLSIVGTDLLVGSLNGTGLGIVTGAAYVFEGSSSGWNEVAVLYASDGQNGAWFGRDVALGGAGDIALIGAIHDSALGLISGAAYVFHRQMNGTWLEEAKILASDGAAEDEYGTGLAFDGSVAFVGAPGHNHPFGGAVYAYRIGTCVSAGGRLVRR